MHNLETKLEKRISAIDTEVNSITENVKATTFVTLSYSGSTLLRLAAERQALRIALEHIRRETPAMAIEKMKETIVHRMTYNTNHPDPIKSQLERMVVEHLAKLVDDHS